MGKIVIDAEMLTMALEDHNNEHFLNLKTGEIEMVTDYIPEGMEDIVQEIENCPENYARIEPIYSSRSFQVLEDFVESLPRSKVKQRLSAALDRRRPFRNFADALKYFPEVREAWFRFHAERYKEFALEWLRSEGIDAELKPLWYERV